MELNTKNIIKALPFEETLKTELLNQFDTLTPDQKYTITRIVWQTWNAIFKLRLEEKVEDALADMREGKGEINPTEYAKLRQETLKEMEKDLSQGITGVDLSAARTAMEKIIQEIK